MPQAGQEATSTDKLIKKMSEKKISEAGYRCVCLNARSIVNKKNGLNIIVEDTDPPHNWYNRIMGQHRHYRC